jgi:hypothetical protein
MVGREEQQQKKKKEREQTSPSNAMLNKQPVKDFPCPLRQNKMWYQKARKRFFVGKIPHPFRITVRPVYAVQDKKENSRNWWREIEDNRRRAFFDRAHGKTIQDLSSRAIVAAREHRSRIQKLKELRDQAGRAFMQSNKQAPWIHVTQEWQGRKIETLAIYAGEQKVTWA